MKDLQRLYDELKNMHNDLFNNYRTDFKEKFEITGRFMQDELEDAIDIIDSAIDRIKELEGELEEAQDRIDELERELDEAV